jgi:hypothetical protein
MLNRIMPVLRIICYALAALLAARIALIIAHYNPLARVSIPAIPALAESADTQGAAPTNNAAPAVAGTNAVAAKSGTNSVATNAVATTGGTNGAATNVAVASHVTTNTAPTNSATTNVLSAKTATTNGTSTNVASSKLASTNVVSTGKTSTNSASAASVTNLVGKSGSRTNSAGTNAIAGGSGKPKGPNGNPGGRNGGPGGMPPVDAPPEIRARIDKIVQSEILGPVMHPMPMALLGIAGDSVFLRGPNGQTGLVKEGGELDGLKLLRIGINRVLVDDQGEEKELTIFSGLGGQSLLSKEKDKTK